MRNLSSGHLHIYEEVFETLFNWTKWLLAGDDCLREVVARRELLINYVINKKNSCDAKGIQWFIEIKENAVL